VPCTTDAAQKVGYGWQLLQLGEDNKLHPVSYGGQAVTRAQANWTAAQLELSVVVVIVNLYSAFM